MVLHIELLAEALRQLRREHTRDRVDRAARCEWRDHPDGPIGITGCLRKAGICGQKRGEAEHDRLHLAVLSLRRQIIQPSGCCGGLSGSARQASLNRP
jgi:hypothetical protein